jgi:undecaprenyl diphosphate synthase
MADKKLALPLGTKVPDHIAIIPDGNRRWARAKGLPTLAGHKRGFQVAVKLAKAARDLGVHTVTLWGFSTENWDRSKEEVDYLMKLYEKLVDDYLKEAKEDKVKLVHLGRKDRIPKFLLKKILQAEEETKKNDKYIANLAIDYGGRDEIIRATKKIVADKIAPEKIDEKLFESYLDTHDQPYPYVDLLIRTSGEQRTSTLLPWQAGYAELYWFEGHFPDFTPIELREAILDYSRRRRRFGGNDAEEHLTFHPEVAAKLELRWWRLRRIPEGTRLTEYAIQHLKEQYGLSKKLASRAAKYFIQALKDEKEEDWEKVAVSLKKFYGLIKGEIKLAFEPKIAAYLEVKLWEKLKGGGRIKEMSEAEEAAREQLAEVYRISLFQAAKAAHLRVMAGIERNLAEHGFGESHWAKAEEYLTRYYKALKERVA